MSQIMKAFMGVFLMLFMAVTSISILCAYLNVMSAQDMHAGIIDEIENSDFSPSVLRECYTGCESAGNSLVVTLYSADKVLATLHKASEVPTSIEGVDTAKVEMSFVFKVPILGIEKTHSFTGYAR